MKYWLLEATMKAIFPSLISSMKKSAHIVAVLKSSILEVVGGNARVATEHTA
jgi:hypothetical protein